MRLADCIWWTRKRLLDEERIVFPEDGRIVTALNVGAQLVQRAVMRGAPDAFRKRYARNLESGIYRYQLPRGFIREKQVFVNGFEASPGMEAWIETGRYGSELRYCITGGELVISPVPGKSVEDGLVILYVPALGMAEPDDDLQDLGLVEPLHFAVVLYAVKLLQPAGGESNKDIDAELGLLLADVPTYYPTQGIGQPLEVEGLGLELSGISDRAYTR